MIRTCGGEAELTAAETAELAARAGAMHQAEDQAVCELQDGHDGPHLAMCQAYDLGETEVWLRWGPGDRRLIEVADVGHCELTGTPAAYPGAEPWICELPARHPGAHSFEITGAPGKVPAARYG